MMKTLFVYVFLTAIGISGLGQSSEPLPGTKLLTPSSDLSAEMVAGINRYLTRAAAQSVEERQKLWSRDFSPPDAYVRSVETNRQRLRRYIGAVDERVSRPSLEIMATTEHSGLLGEDERIRIRMQA